MTVTRRRIFGTSTVAFFSDKEYYKRYIREFPELERLLSLTNYGRLGSFWSFLPAFCEFLQSAFVERFLAFELRRVASLVSYDSLLQDTGIEVLETPAFKLTIGRLAEGSLLQTERRELACYANSFVYINCGPGELSAELYEVPETQINEIFDRSQIPVLEERFLQKKGDIVQVHAGRHILKLLDASDTAYQAYFVSNVTHSLVWHYDSETLVPKYSTAGFQNSSRIQAALDIVARLGSSHALPSLKPILESPDHFVRWHAVKLSLALNASDAKELLRTVCDDPHPHVRTAAQVAWRELSMKPHGC